MGGAGAVDAAARGGGAAGGGAGGTTVLQLDGRIMGTLVAQALAGPTRAAATVRMLAGRVPGQIPLVGG